MEALLGVPRPGSPEAGYGNISGIFRVSGKKYTKTVFLRGNYGRMRLFCRKSSRMAGISGYGYITMKNNYLNCFLRHIGTKIPELFIMRS